MIYLITPIYFSEETEISFESEHWKLKNINIKKAEKKGNKKPPGQKISDNKPSRIIEEIIAKYAVDANLFRLGSTNPTKK